MKDKKLLSPKTIWLTAFAVTLFIAMGLTSYSQDNSISLMEPHRDTVANWRALLSGGHRLGPSDAPVQIVEFSDFECPYCREQEPVLHSIMKKYPGKIAITRYNYPLISIHPYALPAAIAAECAAKQGKYDTYHDVLFNNQDKFESHPWDSLAKVAGVSDIKAFQGCVANEETKSVVMSDRKLGDSLKVKWTPTLIVNGVVYPGVSSSVTLNKAVKSILSK